MLAKKTRNVEPVVVPELVEPGMVARIVEPVFKALVGGLQNRNQPPRHHLLDRTQVVSPRDRNTGARIAATRFRAAAFLSR